MSSLATIDTSCIPAFDAKTYTRLYRLGFPFTPVENYIFPFNCQKDTDKYYTDIYSFMNRRNSYNLYSLNLLNIKFNESSNYNTFEHAISDELIFYFNQFNTINARGQALLDNPIINEFIKMDITDTHDKYYPIRRFYWNHIHMFMHRITYRIIKSKSTEITNEQKQEFFRNLYSFTNKSFLNFVECYCNIHQIHLEVVNEDNVDVIENRRFKSSVEGVYCSYLISFLRNVGGYSILHPNITTVQERLNNEYGIINFGNLPEIYFPYYRVNNWIAFGEHINETRSDIEREAREQEEYEAEHQDDDDEEEDEEDEEDDD
jgi:hypothetical protein